MTIDQLKNNLGEYAKDIRLNLSAVLTEEGAPLLKQRQIYFIALACSYATKNTDLITIILAESELILSREDRQAAKSAATIMAMNNVYYRFIHLVSDKSFAGMPAKLRMNVIANPGIDKTDFELACLAISALNGCGMCMEAHIKVLRENNIDPISIQSAVRIAAVFNAVATATTIR